MLTIERLNSDEINRQAAVLCERAMQGNLAAASELIELFYEKIFVWMCRLSGEKADAEDLTQRTFCKVWESLGSFERRSSFSTWIHRIAYHTYVDWRREPQGRLSYPSEAWWETCESSVPSPLDNVGQRDLARVLFAEVEQLDETTKPIIYLHYYDGLSLKETSEILGVSTSTVKYRLREAMRHLKSRLKNGSE
jgi:RNA polymerase sigma-70 factor (ECF subfamily)